MRRTTMETRRFNPWLVLVIVGLAQFMVILDATNVNVALPSIQRSLHLSPSSLQWIVNGYALTFGGFLMLGGRSADLVGRKRLFVVIAMLLAIRIVPESGAQDVRGGVDIAGAVSITAGLLVLVYAIVNAQSAGWLSLTTVGLAAIAAALLGIFIVLQVRLRHPL